MADLQEIFDNVEPAQPTEAVEPKIDVSEEGEEASTEEGGREQKTVPLAALQQERAKGKKYTEQTAEFDRTLKEQNALWEQRFHQLSATMQPRQPAPKAEEQNFWDAPEATIDNRITQAFAPLQQSMAAQREQFSATLAVEKYGQEAVDAAYDEMKQRMARNPGQARFDHERIMASPHPYGALVEWHKQQQTMNEIGNDPAAYKEKVISEYLAAQEGGKEPVTQTPTPVMPSNFATGRNVGARSGPAWSGPASLADVFDRR